MSFESELQNVMSRLIIVESDWKFVTSAGGELTIGTPIVHVGVNATGGALWVKRDSDSSETCLRYGGIGGSVSLSLIPSPANFSFSIPQMPSAGRIYKLPFAGRTLSRSEFTGAFVLMEISGDFGPGLSGALMFIGGSLLAAAIAGGASAGTLQIPAIIATSNACARFGGLTATLLPANIGLSFYVGGIFA
ncbi:MAG: hypothetical protein H7Z37_06900 [Pyrinomonadaceae bacterium]|nr:hypothetical protein [Pyrinomonadaceae bacterium]